MNMRIKKFGVIIAAALVGVLAFSAISFAQTPDTSTSSAPLVERIQQGFQNGFERGGPGGRGGPGNFGEERGVNGGGHQEELAAALGMTTEELQTAIQNGQTIEEIAAEQGVDLQAFALAQAQKHLAQAVTDGKLTQEEADAKLAEIQTAIENGEFPGPRGSRGDGPGNFGPRGERDGALAEALGMTTEELHTAIQNGQTIEEIAAENDVDLEAFQAEQQAEHQAQAQERLAQAVEDGKLTQEQADQILEQIQNGERPEFGGRGGPGGQRGPRGGQNNVPFERPANPNL